MAKILLQTTIADIPDDWNIARFFGDREPVFRKVGVWSRRDLAAALTPETVG